jgi:hypothetical protein
MKLESLVVLHLPKHAAPQGEASFAAFNGFVLESCLRWIAIGRVQSSEFRVQGAEEYRGIEAYQFLLEIACGLHSKMQGESEIFGQIKQAWKIYHAEQPLASRELHTFMQRMFADTKKIRTDHLHGIGGQSYAGAVQKLLGLRQDHSLLILGAGQFGSMFAEKLKNKVAQLTVMNRSANKWVTQAGWKKLEDNIAHHTHVLVCLPAGKDAELDARVQAAWSHKKHGKLLHLAQLESYGAEWEQLPHFLTLADVMALQNDQSSARPQAIANAFAAVRLAAEERAQIRAHAA